MFHLFIMATYRKVLYQVKHHMDREGALEWVVAQSLSQKMAQKCSPYLKKKKIILKINKNNYNKIKC
jgi:hypothetical protein